MARRTLTLYLAKPDVEQFEDVLTESAVERLRGQRTQIVNAPEFGDGARLFIFASHVFTPAWLAELGRHFDFNDGILTSSASAVLTFWVGQRLFVSTFATGWMSVNEENIEGSFGLRVALNGLNDDKLRRLERANLGDAMRGVSLSPFQRQFESFGLDDALDLVRKISGVANEGSSADVITGAKSIKLSGEFDVSDLPDLAAECLEAFESTAYRETSFRVLDLVAPVADRRLASELDEELCHRIRNQTGEFELGLPDTQEIQTVGYKFVGLNQRGHRPDLLLEHYVSLLGDRLDQFDTEMVRKHQILSVHDEPGLSQKWSIRMALVGSLEYDGDLYAINEGEWYNLDQPFKVSIDQTFRENRSEWTDQPVRMTRILDEKGNAKFESEARYNRSVAGQKGWLCLDQKLISVAGVQRSEFEVCDLLDIENKVLIHVKKSSRKSSVLSHFFKQGSNSTQQMAKFGGAWDALAERLEEEFGVEHAEALREAMEDDTPWTVEFLIADSTRANGEFNIPFFSKITLRDELSSLKAMGYDVRLKFLRLEREAL